MKHGSKDWPIFVGQVLHYITWKGEWTAHHAENYWGLQGGCPEEDVGEAVPQASGKEMVRYKSTVTQVWEYLDRAYLYQDTYLHDLMKLVQAVRDISDKN